MVQIMSDKQPTEEEARQQLLRQLAVKERCGNLASWNITDVIEMDDEGETEYLVYDGNVWQRREEVECEESK